MSDPVAGDLPVCTCPLIESKRGHAATVVAIQCGEGEACRLRALGLYEGAQVCVIDRRHCLLVDVRGTRLALGNDLASDITVRTTGPIRELA